MYSVMRFVSENKEDPALYKLGDALNKVEIDIFEGLNRNKNSINISVDRSQNDIEHLLNIAQFVKRFERPILLAKELSLSILLDLGIYRFERPENIVSSYIPLDFKFMSLLHKYRIELEFSIYWDW